jgi:hypothetical protein
MTVPFIMALGIGVASISADGGEDANFGLVALCSIGPILAVMILALIFPGTPEVAHTDPNLDHMFSRQLVGTFVEEIPHSMLNMAKALGPIVAFYLVFRLVTGGVGTGGLGKTMMGVLYTYVGLVLFLTGVEVGFMPVGSYLGASIAASKAKFLIIPLGMIIGYFIVAAEPAVHVLKKQVEEVTAGTIPGKVLATTLSVGVAVSVGIAMLRVLTGLPIMWILIPGYGIALALSFFVPDIFTAIAFDSGGVASGPMTATFLLPFAIGACGAVGGNVVEDAFGVVAMVAMTPLIAIQILGLIYKIRSAKKTEDPVAIEEEQVEELPVTVSESEDIIEL